MSTKLVTTSFKTPYVSLDLLSYLKSGQVTPFQIFNDVIMPDFKDHISKGNNSDETRRKVQQIQDDLIPIREACWSFQQWEEYVSCAIKELAFQSLDDAFKERTESLENTNRTNFLRDKVDRTHSIVSRLKELVCSPSLNLSYDLDTPPTGEELQRLNMDAKRKMEAIYDGFDERLKRCFLCFSVIPEGAVIKKKVLIHWWVGEGFIDDTLATATGGGKTAEETGNEFFKEFLDKGIIELVYKKRRPSADSCKMQPPIRYAVIELAKREFFDFDKNGNPTEDFSSSQRACLERLRTIDKVIALKEMEAIYKGFADDKMRSCFLCFSVFPEGAVIKKKVLIHWWVGEGFIDTLDTEAGKTAEETGNKFFKEFLDKGIIEPVYKKRRPSADSCKMEPPIRYAVIELAKRDKFFDFDENGNPTEDFSVSRRACLVRTIEGSNVRELPFRSSQDKVQSLINVSEPYLYFRPNWFSKMISVKVLQLGRWKRSAELPEHLVEVEDCEFLKGLKNMRELRYLSLRGISRITELPASICKARNLRILNLNGCCDLEKLPQGIGSLKNLTHLDMYECYLISSMPKGLALLSQLQVLKGFVISKARPGGQDCTLADLSTLQNLRKLSIHIDKKQAGTAESELNSLTKFKKLRSLSISWSRIYDKPATHTLQRTLQRTLTKTLTSMPKRPPMAPIIAPDSPLAVLLEKLDLHYFPHSNLPIWLRPELLGNLKKLYIRGGILSDLCHSGFECRWTVQMVHLKFLDELQMDWGKLQDLFPQLRYLEISECPKLNFDQCDENGVWKRADSKQEEASSSNA